MEQIHPSLQKPLLSALAKNILQCSPSTSSPIDKNNAIVNVIGGIYSLHPFLQAAQVKEDFTADVYLYNDAPTPFPRRDLKVSSFIGMQAFQVFVHIGNSPRQYIIAVKHPCEIRHLGGRDKIRHSQNSGRFHALLSHLRSNNIVAVLEEGGRIGFVVPNKSCDYSACVVYLSMDEAKHRIEELKQEEKESLEREEELANDIEERRSLLSATTDESYRFILKCMVIIVDNIRGLDVDTIKQLFSEIGEVSWQGRGQLGGMGCLVMPYDVGMIAIDRLNATEIKGRLLRVRKALNQRIASDVAKELSLTRYPESRKKQKIDNETVTEYRDLEEGEICEDEVAPPLCGCGSVTSPGITQEQVLAGKTCSCGHDSCDECGGSSRQEDQPTLVSPASGTELPPTQKYGDVESARTALMQKKIDEMKLRVQFVKVRWEDERNQMLIGNTHLSIMERSVRSKGPAQPVRKHPAKDPLVYGFSSKEEYELLRYKAIISIIDSPFAEYYPMLAQQCVLYLELVGPADIIKICGNHCAVQYDHGHHNMHTNVGSRRGYKFKLCCSVIAQMAISDYWADITSIECGDDIGHVQNFNMFEYCLTQGCKFQHCGAGTTEGTAPLVEGLNLYLESLSTLAAKVLLTSNAGYASRMTELVLSNLVSPSENVSLTEEATRHLQHLRTPVKTLSVKESARRMTMEISKLSTELIEPFLMRAGIIPEKTFIQYAIDHADLPFVTDDPSNLEETIRHSFTKEGRIRSILRACFDALEEDADALVGGQADVIQVYASYHRDEIQQLLGEDAPGDGDWNFFPVRSILRNMGRNSQELLKAALGEEEYSQLMSDLGTKSQEILKAALGEEEYSQLMSDLGTKSSEILKTTLGEEEYSQRYFDMGTKSSEILKTTLGEEEYSQRYFDMGKKGGFGSEAKMKKNLTDGKSVHVIQCIDDSGQEGCAGETWMIGCYKGSDSLTGSFTSCCRKCRQGGGGRHNYWKVIGRALDDEEEVSEAFQLKMEDKSLAYVTKALKLD